MGQLPGVGVELYYLPNGATADFAFELPQNGIADAFDGDVVRTEFPGLNLSSTRLRLL